MKLVKRSFSSVILCTLASLAPADEFDEMNAANSFRPQYEAFIEERSLRGSGSDQEFEATVREVYEGSSYTISPTPRILTADEYNVLRLGVAQRGNALASFLQDYYSGSHSYERAGILTRTQVEALMIESKNIGYSLKNGASVRFMYGPDIVRDSQGRWVVLEDNASVVGGMADAISAVSIFHDFYPGLSRQYQEAKPSFFSELVHEYKRQAKGKTVVLITSNCNDLEVNRMGAMFQNLGVHVDCPSLLSEWFYDFNRTQPQMKNSVTGEIKEIGFVAIHSLFSFVDAHHKQAKTERLISEIEGHLAYPQLPDNIRLQMNLAIEAYRQGQAINVEELENLANHNSFFSLYDGQETFFTNFAQAILDATAKFNGLSEAILENRLPSNITPGIQVLSHKELYPCVSQFISHYLGEEPILKSLETYTLSENPDLAQQQLARIRSERSSWVLKDQVGLGGEGVIVGRYESSEDWDKALETVEGNPSAFQAQEYIELSRLGESIVDMRLHAQIMFGREAIVSNTPYSRGSPAKAGRGRVNISQGGKQFAVLVEKTRSNCIKNLDSEGLKER